MIKLIRTDQLQPGMFIQDLNCGWLDHPFLTNAFHVRDTATVAKIISLGIKEVYIDTVKGADVREARPQVDVNAELQARLEEIARKKAERPVVVELKEEAARARRLQAEAYKVANLVLEDLRLASRSRSNACIRWSTAWSSRFSAIRMRCCRWSA